jgi:hypothetical protein
MLLFMLPVFRRWRLRQKPLPAAQSAASHEQPNQQPSRQPRRWLRTIAKTVVTLVLFSLLATYLGQVQENRRLLREDRKAELALKAQQASKEQAAKDALAKEQALREEVAKQQARIKADEEKRERKRQLYAEFEAQFVPAAECRHPTEEDYVKCMDARHLAKTAFYQKHDMR